MNRRWKPIVEVPPTVEEPPTVEDNAQAVEEVTAEAVENSQVPTTEEVDSNGELEEEMLRQERIRKGKTHMIEVDYVVSDIEEKYFPEWLKVVLFDSDGERVFEEAYVDDDNTDEEVEPTDNVEEPNAEEDAEEDNVDVDNVLLQDDPIEDVPDSYGRRVWDLDDIRTKVPMKLGTSFRNGRVFRALFKAYAARIGFDYDFKRNEKKKIGILCANKKCGFWCYASAPKHSEVMEIRTWTPHMQMCPRKLVNPKITSDFLAQRFCREIRNTIGMNIETLGNIIQKKLQVTMAPGKLYRTISKAREIIAGDLARQYEELFTYCEMIRRTNPGSKAMLMVEHEVFPPDPGKNPRFLRLYIRYKAQKDGFLAGCRPLVGLDGCHLKGRYGGQLRAAVGFDADDGMFPLAFAIVEQENKSSWRWFLEQFFDDYGLEGMRDWVFISDRQKGLMQLFKEWLPHAEHRFCMRHIYENWYLKFRSDELTSLMYACSRSTTVEKFNERLEAVKKINEDAYNWLREIEPSGWCKTYFTDTARSNLQVNDMSESFNRWILKGRNKSILDLCEYLSIKLMKLFFKRHTKFDHFQGTICPNIQLVLEGIKLKSRNCHAIPSSLHCFEVCEGDRTYVVDMEEKKCSCLYWQLRGIPCRHAITSITELRNEAEPYVHQYYHVDTYKKIYCEFVNPIPSKDTWPTTLHYPKVDPPNVQKPPGRPRVRRRKSTAEKLIDVARASKKNCRMTCSKCGGAGHNMRTCSAKDHGETSTARKARKGNTTTKGKKDVWYTTEEERAAVMEKRRQAVAKRLNKGRKCTPTEIEAKRLVAEQMMAQRQSQMEGEPSSKRRKLTPRRSSNLGSSESESRPSIGIAAAELNRKQKNHQSPFVSLQSQGARARTLTEDARFFRPPTSGQRGRGGRRGGRSTSSQGCPHPPTTTSTPPTSSSQP